jgi:hypothetical protein
MTNVCPSHVLTAADPDTGFRVEGVKRDALAFDGRRVDSIIMAALAPEWTDTITSPAW